MNDEGKLIVRLIVFWFVALGITTCSSVKAAITPAHPYGCQQVEAQLYTFQASISNDPSLIDDVAFLGGIEAQLSADSADVKVPRNLAMAEGSLASSFIDATNGYNVHGYETYLKQIRAICGPGKDYGLGAK
jgi:hypothetical protein